MSGAESKQEPKAKISDKTLARDSKQHLVTYSKVRPHECLVCHKGFVRADSLKNHICIQTEGKPRAIVRIDFTRDDTELKGFIPKRRDRDSTLGPIPCEICGKHFPSHGLVKIHLRKHTKERPYICEVCGRAYIFKKNLKYHLCTHTGEKPFVCEHCGKAYILKGNLRRHILTHTGEKPYRCSVCGKAFAAKNSLKIHHQVAHTGDLPFPCKLCGKRFPTIYQLKSHNVIHTRELKYSCPVCKKKFHWRASCRNHMIIHSKNSLRPVVNKSLHRRKSSSHIHPVEKS